MKRLALTLVFCIPLAGCVATTSDLALLHDRLTERLAEGDEKATDVLRDEFSRTIDDIKDRAEVGLEEMLEIGGPPSLLAAVALHFIRNKTRKKEIPRVVHENVKDEALV